MRAEDFVSRLEKVRRTGSGRWIACCPAHEDKTPSLTVRELEDGRILVHCHGGCGVYSVVHAVGVDLSDLFPDKLIADKVRPLRKPFPAEDVISAMEIEIGVVMICAGDIAEGRTLKPTDRERLKLARQRLDGALRMARGER